MKFSNRLVIDITQAHINSGLCGSPGFCAGALAIKDKLVIEKDAVLPLNVMAGYKECSVIYWDKNYKRHSAKYKTSTRLARFMNSFDSRKNPKPARFILTKIS